MHYTALKTTLLKTIFMNTKQIAKNSWNETDNIITNLSRMPTY